MKSVDHYVDQVFNHTHSKDEWLALQMEVDNWLAECSKQQEADFCESGAGETLYMIASGYGSVIPFPESMKAKY